ncbi:MAG: hypothetical protein AAF311_13430 [Pseudomonadota bacterium]
METKNDTRLTRNGAAALALGTAALALAACATAAEQADWPDPASAAASGWTQDRFDAWVESRAGAPATVGESGDPVYWYSLGTLRAFPGGDMLYTLEGYDISNARRVSPTKAEQYSRKIYIYRDAETGAVVDEVNGEPVEPIAYPYQFITYELKENADGEAYLETFVEQGVEPRVQEIGPGTDITVRQFGELQLYTAPLFLDFPLPDGSQYQTFENYDFIIPEEDDDGPAIITFMRYGPLPGFAKTDQAEMGAMHMQTWRIEDYEDVPASLRDYVEAEAPLWAAPPADLADIRRLQGRTP